MSSMRTLHADPTTTTLAPTSDAPDSVATTVPETVPVCCAIRGTKGTASRNTTDSRSAGVDLTGHLLENGGSQVQVWASNTASPADPLPGAFSSRFADRSQPGCEREPLEFLEWEGQQQIDPLADQHERVPECRLRGRSAALDLRGVGHAPVREDGLAGEDRARFLGTVAHRDNEVPRLPLQPVDAARGTAGPRDVVFAQRLDRVRIHPIGGA